MAVESHEEVSGGKHDQSRMSACWGRMHPFALQCLPKAGHGTESCHYASFTRPARGPEPVRKGPLNIQASFCW